MNTKRAATTAALVGAGLLAGTVAASAATATTHAPGSYCKKADHGKTGTYTTPKTKKTYVVICRSYTAWHWVKK
jgi:Spy/CpxP family protein refolding chaperone